MIVDRTPARHPTDPPTPPTGTRSITALLTDPHGIPVPVPSGSAAVPVPSESGVGKDRPGESRFRSVELPDADEEFLRAWAHDLATPPRGLPRRRPPLRIVLPRVLRRRSLVAAGVVLLAVLGAVVGGGYLLTENIGEQVQRVPDVFGGLDPSARPVAGGALTFLLVGTDSRSAGPTTGSDASATVDPGAQRSDVLMVARLNPDRTTAAVASIPRDSVVDIPGHGRDKINAAYALGGPPLLVRTVENLTGIRVDHFAVIDFAGFRSVVDAVGGIDVDVDAATSNDGVFFHAGVNHLDGRAALAYVRQRDGLGAGGDIDRAQRELGALRALVTRVVEQGTLSSPAGTYELLDATSRSMSVDDTLDNGGLRTLVSTLHDLEPTDITFVRAPVGAVGRAGDAVLLDTTRSTQLWDALRADRVTDYAAAHPGDTLGAVTR